MAKKYDVKTVFGADILFDAAAASRQGSYLAMLSRWMTPAEALQVGDREHGRAAGALGFINPYPGKLGVVEEGALADLLLVDGNPLENSRSRRQSRQEFPYHHERRSDIQGQSVKVAFRMYRSGRR